MSSNYQNAKSNVAEVEINLEGGEVKGDIYAGGYVYTDDNGVQTGPEATVGSATVNLKGGVFSGKLIDGTGADTATLSVTPAEYAFDDGQKVEGFDTIKADGTVTNLAYDFGNRDSTTIENGTVEFTSISGVGDAGKTLAVGEKSTAIAVFAQGALARPDAESESGTLTIDVANGFAAFNSDVATAASVAASQQAQSAAYVTGTLNLDNMRLVLGDASAETTGNGLFAGANGTLIADAAGNTRITGTTSFASESAIHFTNVAAAADETKTVSILLNADDAPQTTVDNVLFVAERKADNTGYTFARRSADQLGAVGLSDFDDLDFLAQVNGSASTNRGARFVSGFLDEGAAGVNSSNRSQQLNAAVNLATAAGVQTAAIDGTMMGIEAANKRASIINNFVDGGELFAELAGKHYEMGGGSSFGEIEADMGGLVVGGQYNINDWTFGALANLGTGSIDGNGKNSGVENDVDYYGIEAYVARRFGQFNIVGQVGYLMSDNDVEHKTMGYNSANVDADVFTVGVRGEMRFDITENTRLVPYVGINYLRVSTDGYTTSQGVKVDDIDQNLWTVPLGVKFAGDMQTASGWTWTPAIDVAYIPSFGDDDVDATTDVGAVAHTTMDVWTNSVGRVKFGISAMKDNFGFGLEAGAAAGSDDMTEYFGQVRVDYRF